MRATAACFAWRMSPRHPETNSLWDVACSNLSAENNIAQKFQYNLRQIIEDINIAKPLLPNDLAEAIFEPDEEMQFALSLLDPSIDTKLDPSIDTKLDPINRHEPTNYGKTVEGKTVEGKTVEGKTVEARLRSDTQRSSTDN